MKMRRIISILATTLVVFWGASSARSQGTINFDYPWVNDGLGGFSLNYYSGMSFRVDPYPPQPHDDVMLVGATGPAGYPHNGTPYAAFISTLGIPQQVIFARTNAASLGRPFLNGDHFGLLSVDLADPMAPSLSPVAITFNGFKAGGVMVSQTFTVGGGGSSSFQKVYFGSDFAGGLLRVEIPSPAWAMDNIVWIPEPNGAALLLGGLVFLALRRRR
jgi:hypothetical protein